MRLFDLHCDTLYKTFSEKKSLISNDCELSVERGMEFENWIQCMAVWIPDEVRGDSAVKLVENCHAHLLSELTRTNGSVVQLDKFGKNIHSHNIMLTLEGGACLAGNLKNVEYFRSLGARAMTLTWNGSCEVGDGADVENSKGLSGFGRMVIPEMERTGIVVDVSHASDRLFYDVAQIAKKPFIATHSNSRAVYNHRRNLTDEQFAVIRDIGGLVGLNFHKHFLAEENQSIADIIRHAEHFLSLGGENVLAVGSDFDGAEMPDDICSITDFYKIYEEFLKLNYNEELLDKLFYQNAYNFYQSFDN